MKENDETKKAKVILVGETGVGKTGIIYRYVNNSFNYDTMSTITASFQEKTITLNDDNKTKVKFTIWDTCGQEKYRDLAGIFFKDAKAVILVYDSTTKNTFKEIKNYWYNKVKENTDEDIVLAVASNKMDLFDKEEVSEEEGMAYADEINAIFMMTSAYTGGGINELFENIGMKVAKVKENENLTGSIKLDKNTFKEKGNNNHKKCCYYY